MTLRNSERTYLYKETYLYKFHGFFFKKNTFQKIRKVCAQREKKVSRISVQCLEATRKGVRKTDRKTPLPESILNNLNFPKHGFHHSRFPANFLKVFIKRRTAALQQNLKTELNLSQFEKRNRKKETNSSENCLLFSE